MPPVLVWLAGAALPVFLMWSWLQKEYEDKNITGKNKLEGNCTFLLYSHKQAEVEGC